MQAADFWNLDHMTERRKLDGSADRRIFFERQMRTASIVIFEIILRLPKFNQFSQNAVFGRDTYSSIDAEPKNLKG
jgi:hypothetical protein